MMGGAPVVWVRSEPIPAPTTGRLAVIAWMRVADASRQPQMRLAIEGKRDGRVHYQYGQIGLDDAGRPARTQLSDQWNRCQLVLTNFPLEGLSDLRVGFDLMGEGDVWIDEVRVFDCLFEESERTELFKSSYTSHVQLESGQLAECQRFLDGYWPSFLRRHVPLPAARPSSALAPPKPPRPGDNAAAKKPDETASRTTWDKMKSWLPKSWR
jgi:hypothetical protein